VLIINSKLTRALMHIRLKTNALMVYQPIRGYFNVFKRAKIKNNNSVIIVIAHKITATTIVFDIINCLDGEFFFCL